MENALAVNLETKPSLVSLGSKETNGDCVTLDSVKPGSEVLIKEIHSSNPFLFRKLNSMGLISGRVLKVIGRAPLGDPISVSVLGYILSLRLSEAKDIVVTIL